MDDGLPSNVIWTLAETRDGAMWVGTPKAWRGSWAAA